MVDAPEGSSRRTRVKGLAGVLVGVVVIAAGAVVFTMSRGGEDGVVREAAAEDCVPTLFVIRHAEDEKDLDGGPDKLSTIGLRHADLYPLLFEQYLSTTHGVTNDKKPCPIDRIIAIDKDPNDANRSPAGNPFNTIKPLADELGKTIETADAEGTPYSTVYDWGTKDKSRLLGSSTSTVIAWDKQGLNPTSDDLNKTITNQAGVTKTLTGWNYTPLLQAMGPSTDTFSGSPQRTELWVFADQQPDGRFASAKKYQQFASTDCGKTWKQDTNWIPDPKTNPLNWDPSKANAITVDTIKPPFGCLDGSPEAAPSQSPESAPSASQPQESPDAAPSGSPSPSGCVVAAGRDLGAGIEAESFDATGGVDRSDSFIGGISNGDWVQYRGVCMAPLYRNCTATVASGLEGASGTIEWHLDSRDGPVVYRMDVSNTGGWKTWEGVGFTGGVLDAPGAHDLFLVFRSDGADEFLNVDTISCGE